MVQANDGRPLVTVTGISGYIGSHVGKKLLEDGSFRIRGTVRDKNNADKIDPLREAYGELFDQIELVEADLLDSDSMARAIAGSTYVLHIASPFQIEEPADEMELIRPAVEGTRSMLEACKAAGVRRVSITSSVASVVEMANEDKPDVFNESHWTNPEKPNIGAYTKSKALAEKAAWKWIEDQPEGENKIELTVINPGFVVGPTLVKAGFASGKVISMFMNNKLPGGVPRLSFSTVDVRDVAQAHINCIKNDEAQGKRFILTNRSLWWREIAQILNTNFEPQGYTIPTVEAKFCLVKFIGFFRSDAAKVAEMWDREVVCDNTRSREVLGIEYTDLADSIREMGESMIAKGVVPDRRPAKE